MSSPEFLSEVYSLVPEARKGQVRNFGEMIGILPNSLLESEINLLQDYFMVQVTYAEGARNKAREMMKGLVKKRLSKMVGWDEFEDAHRKLLAVIDVAVRGETRQFSDISSAIGLAREPKKK